MRVIEEAAIAQAELPVAQLAEHLRLNGDIAEDAALQGQLAGYLRAALAAIEGRVGKVLIARDVVLRLAQWRNGDRQPLPLAPVTAVLAVRVIEEGAPQVDVPSARWYLEEDAHRPHLCARGVSLPRVPAGGRAEVVLTAGFGPWGSVPSDLRQAVLALAAQFYEYRHEPVGQAGALPFAIQSLIEPWRVVRVLGGGA